MIPPGRIGLRKNTKKVILFLRSSSFFNPKYIETTEQVAGEASIALFMSYFYYWCGSCHFNSSHNVIMVSYVCYAENCIQ